MKMDFPLFDSSCHELSGSNFFDPGNISSQEAYALLNTRFTMAGKQTALALLAKNPTDEIYFGYGFGDAGFPNQISHDLPGMFGTSPTHRLKKFPERTSVNRL